MIQRTNSLGNEYSSIRHYLYLQTQFGEDRCTQFRVIVVTDPYTHPQTPPARPPIANRQDRLQYTVPQLARSVITRVRTFLLSEATSHTVHVVNRAYHELCMSRTVLFDKPACESSRLLCSVFCTCLDHSYVEFTISYKR